MIFVVLLIPAHMYFLCNIVELTQILKRPGGICSFQQTVSTAGMRDNLEYLAWKRNYHCTIYLPGIHQSSPFSVTN